MNNKQKWRHHGDGWDIMEMDAGSTDKLNNTLLSDDEDHKSLR